MPRTAKDITRIPGRDPYRTAAEQLVARSGCTIRAWRSSISGCAWTACPDWGIEVPEPRGPVSFGVFAHEVGHQMLHRRDTGNRARPRWQMEFEAEQYALDRFDEFDLPGFARYEQHAQLHLLRMSARALRRRADPELLKRRSPTWFIPTLLLVAEAFAVAV